MRRDSHLLRRHALVAAVMIISGGGAGSALAQVAASGDEPARPARVLTATGALAERLAAYNPPPDNPVLVAGAGERVVAVVFTANPADIPPLLEKLLVSDVPGCVREGPVGPVACCNLATGTFVLSGEIDGAPVWVRLGERCEPPPSKEGVAFIPVSGEILRELSASYGIDQCFMELAEADGTPRVLVNAPSQDSWPWNYCLREVAEADGTPRALVNAPSQSGELRLALSMMQRSLLRASSPIILAKHITYPPPPPNCILGNIPTCPARGSSNIKKCHSNLRHWFHKAITVSYTKWCYSTTSCPCGS